MNFRLLTPILATLLCWLSFSDRAWAEYRSFLLQIKSSDGKESKIVKSTLDPDQYRGYFPTAPTDQITYLETWKCKGNTANLPMCKSPREIAADVAEAAKLNTPTSP